MKCVVALSGGLDTTSLLAKILAEWSPDDGVPADQILAVGFSYGVKHNRYKNQAAWEIARYYNIPLRLIDLTGVLDGFKNSRAGSPNCNTIFTSVLVGVAESVGAATAYIGINSGDCDSPDRRPDWFDYVRSTLFLSTDGKVSLSAPFLYDCKETVVKSGLLVGAPYHLTRTCRKAQPLPCGHCEGCEERRNVFAAIGAADPIEYQMQSVD